MRKSPWRVDDDEVFQLRGHGGARFTEFVDALIRADAAVSGALLATVRTNIRTNVPDGGVDTEVVEPLSGNSEFATPTIWQYKATDFARVSVNELRAEVAKPYAAKRIREGAAYRVCVCDDTTAQKRRELEEALSAAVAEINPDAPPPKLLSASDLAGWANRFPATVAHFFRPDLIERGLTHAAWATQERAELPTFVLPETWLQPQAALHRHCDFTTSATGPVLAVSGGIGVGKSRLVCEATQGAASLTLCVADESAVTSVSALLNDGRVTAIVVVHGCSLETLDKLRERLRTSDRLRVIAIVDAAEAKHDVINVRRLSEQQCGEVLRANFPSLDSTSRMGTARVCDGVLRVAAWICRGPNHHADGFIEYTANFAGDLISRRVRSDQEKRVLEALSLFSRVGFRRGVEAELDQLASAIGMSRNDVLRVARTLASSSGLVEVGPRYLAVRPRVFARALLQSAWTAWVVDDVSSFLDRFTEQLRCRLLEQFAAHGTPELRDEVARWARPWITGLSSADLIREETWDRLLPLLRLHPKRHLPLLRRKLEALPVGDRAGVAAQAWSMVSVLEELAAKAELYREAEAALFSLALCEPEGGAGPASSRWASSFGVVLSGSSAPFDLRLECLRARFDSAADDPARALVLRALEQALEGWSFRMQGSPLVGGELRPPEWRPATQAQFVECNRKAIALLRDAVANAGMRDGAIQLLGKVGRGLLCMGYLDELVACAEATELTLAQRVSIERFAVEFLDYDCSDEGVRRREHPAEYVERTRRWVENLRGTGLVDRLESALGARSMRAVIEDRAGWEEEIDGLGDELFAERDVLVSLLPRLCQHNQRGLVQLGQRIGALDVAGGLLGRVLDHGMPVGQSLFARGYAIGFASNADGQRDMLASELSIRESTHPTAALDLTNVALEDDIAARAMRLVASGKLPPSSMQSLRSSQSLGNLIAMASTLLDVSGDGALEAARVAIDLLAYPVGQQPNVNFREDQRIRNLAWRALRQALPDAGAGSYWWGQLLSTLAPYDAPEAIDIACSGLQSADFSVVEEAEQILRALAPNYSEQILARLAEDMVDGDGRAAFGVGRQHFWASLPEGELRAWLSEQPIETVRVVARHLPLPFVDSAGKPQLPSLTAYVLSTFEADDETFKQFCAGAHNLQMYVGDISEQKKSEGKVAEAFYTHSLRRVREWALQEQESATWFAQRWAEVDEEEFGSGSG